MPSLRSLVPHSCSSILQSLFIAVVLAAFSSAAHAQRQGDGTGGGVRGEGGEGGLAGTPTGACCIGPNGGCAIVTLEECNTLQGFYFGDGSECSPSCTQTGRCCIYQGGGPTCQVLPLWECSQVPNWGYWQPGGNCDTPCEPQGACCGDGYCYQSPEFLCLAFPNQVWLGAGVDCSECGNLGACCTAAGCTQTLEADCTGVFLGIGTQCADCPTLAEGMCCIDVSGEGLSCLQTTHEDCVAQGGVYYGDGVLCDTDYFCGDVPEAGACCLANGTCIFTTEAICSLNDGTFAGIDVECIDAACADIPGACCFNGGTECQVLLLAECDALGGVFAGPGTDCQPGAGGNCPGWLGKCCLQDAGGNSYCLTEDIDTCFQTPGAVWWSTPGICEDPPPVGQAHCPQFGACCKPDGTCQVLDENLCINFVGGVFKGLGTTCADTDQSGVAEACEEPGDTNGDGVVNVTDLLAVIGEWGPCPPPCPADVAPFPAGDGVVNVTDLLAVIGNWG